MGITRVHRSEYAFMIAHYILLLQPSRSSNTSSDTVVEMEETPAESTTLLNDRILAHQGGWDEIALVAGPLLMLLLLLVIANQRAKRNRKKRDLAELSTSVDFSADRTELSNDI